MCQNVKLLEISCCGSNKMLKNARSDQGLYGLLTECSIKILLKMKDTQ